MQLVDVPGSADACGVDAVTARSYTAKIAKQEGEG